MTGEIKDERRRCRRPANPSTNILRGSHQEKDLEGDYHLKSRDSQHPVISGLWWLVRVRESRTVPQMTEPLSDRWRVRESRTVESVRSWQIWCHRVRESRTVEEAKTSHQQ